MGHLTGDNGAPVAYRFYRDFAKMQRAEQPEDDDEDFGPGDGGGFGSAGATHRYDDLAWSASEPLADIDDGLLEEDLKSLLEGPHTPLSCIVVEYCPDPVTTAKRLRTRDRHDDDDGEDNARVKRPRRGRRYSTSDDERDISDDTNIDIWIYKHSSNELSNRLTHIDAYELCKKMNIRTPPVISTLAWQQSRLNIRRNAEDSFLVSRIQEAFLQEKIRDEEKKPVVRKNVLLKLKEESLSLVEFWDDQDIHEFCKYQGLSTRGDRDDMEARVRSWKNTDIYRNDKGPTIWQGLFW